MKKLLSTKLITTYFILILSIIIIADIVLSIYNTNVLKTNAKENLEQFCENTTDQVDTTLRMMDSTAIEIAIDKDLIIALKNPSLDSKKNIQNIKFILNKNYLNKFNIYRINVFTKYGFAASTNNIDILESKIKEMIYLSKWYNDPSVENGRKFLLEPHKDPWNELFPVDVISLIKAVKDGNETLGYVEIMQDVNVLRNICENQWNGNKLYMAVIDKNNEVFYTNLNRTEEPLIYDNAINSMIQSIKSYSYKTIETDQEIISVNNSNYTELKIVLLLPKKVLLQSNKYFQITLILVLFITTVISFISILIMTKTITKPINNLVHKINKIDINNLSNYIEKDSNSYEADLINTTFIEMANRLKSSIDKENAMHKLQTKAAFDVLQSQIGPHFLYNTLGSIANMCEEGESSGAADACYNLSGILRYAGNYADSIVSLKDEMDSINSYMTLMKYRYRHRINYSLNYEDDILSINLPKLTIQPIVENAIKYSLLENETVFINITSGLVSGIMYLKVEDNGVGIDEDTKQSINNDFWYYTKIKEGSEILNNIKFGGMGLLGTILRLYLHFNEKVGYDITTNKLGGTTVSIYIDFNER